MIATFNQLNAGRIEHANALQKQLLKVDEQIERLDERFYITEELRPELYEKFRSKLLAEKQQIEAEQAKTGEGVSKLEEAVNFAVELSSNLQEIWRLAGYKGKTALQNLVFPEGVTFTRKNGGCRSDKVNSVMVFIASLSTALKDNKISSEKNSEICKAWAH